MSNEPTERSNQSAKARTKVLLAVTAAAVLVFVAVGGFAFWYSGIGPVEAHPIQPPNLKNLNPASGAFGWKLGDTLPDGVTNNVFDGKYGFHPDTAPQPFTQFELELTRDYRIYGIRAVGYAPDVTRDSAALKERLVADLSKEFGLRVHQTNFTGDDPDVYVFGSPAQHARFDIYLGNLFTLEYLDDQLNQVHTDESRLRHP
jgi:hypothetical protein